MQRNLSAIDLLKIKKQQQLEAQRLSADQSVQHYHLSVEIKALTDSINSLLRINPLPPSLQIQLNLQQSLLPHKIYHLNMLKQEVWQTKNNLKIISEEITRLNAEHNAYLIKRSKELVYHNFIPKPFQPTQTNAKENNTSGKRKPQASHPSVSKKIKFLSSQDDRAEISAEQSPFNLAVEGPQQISEQLFHTEDIPLEVLTLLATQHDILSLLNSQNTLEIQKQPPSPVKDRFFKPAQTLAVENDFSEEPLNLDHISYRDLI